MNLEKSRPYNTNLAGKALIYLEGFEKITEKFGYNSFEEFLIHVNDVPAEAIAEAEFTSIVYTKKKLEAGV